MPCSKTPAHPLRRVEMLLNSISSLKFERQQVAKSTISHSLYNNVNRGMLFPTVLILVFCRESLRGLTMGQQSSDVRAQLILNDGAIYNGWAFGSKESTTGEVGEFQHNKNWVTSKEQTPIRISFLCTFLYLILKHFAEVIINKY